MNSASPVNYNLCFLWLICLVAAIVSTPAAADVEFTPNEIIVMLHPGYEIGEVNLRWGTTTVDAYPEADLYLLGIPIERSEVEFAEEISADPAVAEAEPNYYEQTPEGIREMVLSATGGGWVEYLDQTASERIRLAEAHQITRGANVVVAVLDTGIDTTHPVLADMLHAAAYDFLEDDADPQETANGVDDDGDGLVDEGFGHGTMVAGIIALVAPDATLMPLRVLDDEGRGEAFTICKAIRYAEMHGAEVLNLSLGGPLDIDTIELQFEAIDPGELNIISGAGNENLSTPPYFPGASGYVLMVTALDSLDVKAGFADYYEEIFVAAPGDGIMSTYPGGEWAIGSGCSFATPFVAGEAALIRSIVRDPDWNLMNGTIAAAVDEIYALPGNAPYSGQLGHGRIDLRQAVEIALQAIVGVPVEASPTPEPPALLRVFPYPASSGVTLSLPGAQALLRADIYDASGRSIRRLEHLGGTWYWDGRDERGLPAPSGVYLIRATTRSLDVVTGQAMIVR
jgi:subtilisin family serine protease